MLEECVRLDGGNSTYIKFHFVFINIVCGCIEFFQFDLEREMEDRKTEHKKQQQQQNSIK